MGKMCESKGRSIIGASSFRFFIYCSVSKSDRVKGDLGRKAKPNFALLSNLSFSGKFKEGLAKCLCQLYEFTLVAATTVG